MVVLVFTFLGLAGWGVVRQMSHLSSRHPHVSHEHPGESRATCAASRDGGSVSKFERAIRELQGDFGGAERRARLAGEAAGRDVGSGAASPGRRGAGWGRSSGRSAQGVFVVTLVMFMLLEREHLRDRVLSLVGHGHLAATTKALDEAGQRVSRQLLLQTVVNLIYGSIAAAGLWVFGVPYPLFWGACGAVLRFIPYLGPVSAAAGPVLIAFAALPGWTASARGGGVLRRARAVHEHGARNDPVCGRDGRVAGGADGVGGVLDVALGPARAADGDAVDGLSGGAGQARARG